MNGLILESLEIHGFRAFQHVTIEHLGRVNLVVGKNNVGKTSLLEALHFYAKRASPTAIRQILGTHDENRRIRYPGDLISSVKYLFHGRKEIKASTSPIVIGPMHSIENQLSVSLQFFDEDQTQSESIPRFAVRMGNQKEHVFPLNAVTTVNSGSLHELAFEELDGYPVDTNGLNRRTVGELWDNIALTTQEREVLYALRMIAPGIEDISIIGGSGTARDRIAIVKMSNIEEPLPLRSLGDGMQRMLGITLALANAKNNLLFIDEVENGLHYSVQKDLWSLIFRLARRLNVQVFATSHSWDCIESFLQAAQEDEKEEGVLIRLENRKGVVNATVFDEQQLAIATREQIEVR